MYPASSVSGDFNEIPSAPEPVSSLNVNVFAFSILISSFANIPLSVIDIFKSLFTVAVIAADVLSPKSSTSNCVFPSNTLLVISCTVLSSRNRYTLPSAVLIANSPDSN